jgi:hypothetical protein
MFASKSGDDTRVGHLDASLGLAPAWAGEACQGQTPQLITNIHKLRP